MIRSDTIRYDTMEELNMDSKAECDQLHLVHETKTLLCFWSSYEFHRIYKSAKSITNF